MAVERQRDLIFKIEDLIFFVRQQVVGVVEFADFRCVRNDDEVLCSRLAEQSKGKTKKLLLLLFNLQ
jgi:hypothetical protein